MLCRQVRLTDDSKLTVSTDVHLSVSLHPAKATVCPPLTLWQLGEAPELDKWKHSCCCFFLSILLIMKQRF